jgi:lysophospholipase L1-like esterase
MPVPTRRFLIAALCALSLAGPAVSAERPARWVGSWTTASVASDPKAPPVVDPGEITIRQVARLSIGGPRLRLRLSNAFGTAPLRIDGAHVALSAQAASAAIVAGTDRVATFGGKTGVTIPAGASYLSDPVDLPTAGLARLAISLKLPAAPAQPTIHRSARTTAYVVTGDQLSAPDLTGATTNLQWAQLAGVEVESPKGAAIVTLGDSITDGSGAGVDRYERWPDVLAQRLQADPRTRGLAVLNAGIGGNRLLKDGSGPNALARLDRDVFAQPGLQTLIVLIGVNDIGGLSREGPITPEKRTETVEGLIGGYRQIVERAHARGVRVIGATILPFGGTKIYRSDADADADRQAVNAWIRGSGVFDAVLDFDQVTRDPERPERLLPAYDSGDQLHPSPAGYRAMGEAVTIGQLVKR